MANETIAYNKSDLRDIYKAFKLMDEQATEEARAQSAALAYFASAVSFAHLGAHSFALQTYP